MNKVYVLAPNEDWVVDRLTSEWYTDNSDISTQSINDCDVIWLFGGWCYKHIDRRLLQKKKVITTIHHVVPEKFDAIQFYDRDSITDVYHVLTQQTLDFIRPYTTKHIKVIPSWANQFLWKKTGDKLELRQKYNIPIDAYVIGSFQRDTEGFDLKTPKLEKGPDLLVEYVNNKKLEQNVHVVLAGWRREYVINRFMQDNTKYTFFQKPPISTINDLYQLVDVYPITSRYEGGPQSLIECGLLNIPVVSRDVGIARIVLDDSAINNDVTLAIPQVPNVTNLTIPQGYKQYRELICSM